MSVLRRAAELLLLLASGLLLVFLLQRLQPPLWQELALTTAFLLAALAYHWYRTSLAQRALQRLRDDLEQREAQVQAQLTGLREQEQFYRAILDDIPEMICRWRPDGSISYVNRHYCNYLGVTSEALMRDTRFSMFHVGHLRADGTVDAGPYREKPVVEVEFPLAQSGGGQTWQRWIDRALFDEQGNICEFQSVGEDITERKQTEERLLKLADENQQLARMALSIQEEERAQLARELHDEFGQALTAIRADARAIHRINENRNPAISASVDAINETADQVYQTVSNLMQRLRPALLDDLGLIAALREMLFNRWGAQHPEVQLQVRLEEVGQLPSHLRLAAYRIVQEALTNIAKHAQATQVEVSVSRLPGGVLQLAIIDDGCGMDTRIRHTGFGLLGMRERALTLNGTFIIESAPGQGVAIHVELPIGATSAGGGDDHTDD